METAADGQKAEIRAEPDEHLRQCISQIFDMALTSMFTLGVRVVDVGVQFVVMVAV